MTLEKLRNSKNKLDDFFEMLNYEEDDHYLIKRIRTIQYELKEKIKLEEEILNQGNEIELPTWTHDNEYWYIKEYNGIIYALAKYQEGKDDSFHLYSYAFIPNNDGFIRLCVRMLGKDTYGDRVWTNSVYYRTRKSDSDYYSKEYGRGRRYPDKFKEHVKFIIDEFNKLEEVNGGFNPFKSKYEQ